MDIVGDSMTLDPAVCGMSILFIVSFILMLLCLPTVLLLIVFDVVKISSPLAWAPAIILCLSTGLLFGSIINDDSNITAFERSYGVPASEISYGNGRGIAGDLRIGFGYDDGEHDAIYRHGDVRQDIRISVSSGNRVTLYTRGRYGLDVVTPEGRRTRDHTGMILTKRDREEPGHAVGGPQGQRRTGEH